MYLFMRLFTKESNNVAQTVLFLIFFKLAPTSSLLPIAYVCVSLTLLRACF